MHYLGQGLDDWCTTFRLWIRGLVHYLGYIVERVHYLGSIIEGTGAPHGVGLRGLFDNLRLD